MRRFHDISLPLAPGMFTWPGDPAFELERIARIEDGDGANVSRIAASVHLGTHVDAPRHFLADGKGADRLDLDALIGPALVLVLDGCDRIEAGHLRAAARDSLIPAGTERLLLRTRNSQRREAGLPIFPDFCSLAPDAAEWLVANGMRLVGIDGPSIAPLDALEETHRSLLAADIVVLEGLRLEGIARGCYTLCCLPLRLTDADGAPARAVLWETESQQSKKNDESRDRT